MKTFFFIFFLAFFYASKIHSATIIVEPLKVYTWATDFDEFSANVGTNAWDFTLTAVDSDIFVSTLVIDTDVVTNSGTSIVLLFNENMNGESKAKISEYLYRVREGETIKFTAYNSFTLSKDDVITSKLQSFKYGATSATLETYNFNNFWGNPIFLKGVNVPEPSTTIIVLLLSLFLLKRRK